MGFARRVLFWQPGSSRVQKTTQLEGENTKECGEFIQEKEVNSGQHKQGKCTPFTRHRGPQWGELRRVHADASPNALILICWSLYHFIWHHHFWNSGNRICRCCRLKKQQKINTHARLRQHTQYVSPCCCVLGNMAQPMDDAIRSHLLDDCFHMCSPVRLPAAVTTTIRNNSSSSLLT